MRIGEGLSQSLILYAYAVFLGAGYILAFWRPLGFNIFPYLAPTDLILSPLNRVSMLLAMVVLPVMFNADLKQKALKSGVGLVVLVLVHYVVGLSDLIKSIRAFIDFGFRFENESSLIFVAISSLLASVFMLIKGVVPGSGIAPKIMSIVLAQFQMVICAGYSDGKALFNGASNVHFLEQKEMCDGKDIRDWVYIEKYGGGVFFMNTVDKRLCLLKESKFNLIPRKYAEGL